MIELIIGLQGKYLKKYKDTSIRSVNDVRISLFEKYIKLILDVEDCSFKNNTVTINGEEWILKHIGIVKIIYNLCFFNGVIVLNKPEKEINVKQQLELGSLIIESSNLGNKIICETDSSNIVIRILEICKEMKILLDYKDDV